MEKEKLQLKLTKKIVREEIIKNDNKVIKNQDFNGQKIQNEKSIIEDNKISDDEIITKEIVKTNKYFARICSVQILYSHFIDDKQNIDELINYEITKNSAKLKSYKDFIQKQISQSFENSDAIKMIIAKYIKKYKNVEDIQPLTLAILFNAIVEILTELKTKKAVIINEYINITAEFFTKKECAFVNAILDKYVKEYHND